LEYIIAASIGGGMKVARGGCTRSFPGMPFQIGGWPTPGAVARTEKLFSHTRILSQTGGMEGGGVESTCPVTR